MGLIRAIEEAEFQKNVQKEFDKQRRAIIEEIQSDLPLLDELFWDERRKSMELAILPFLLEIYDRSLNTMLKRLSLKQDLFGEFAARAFRWARGFTAVVVRDVTHTTERFVSKAVAEFIASPQAVVSDLTNTLSTIFSPSRAEAIAVTEYTRAHYEGTRDAAEEMRRAGFNTIGVWLTAMDDRVCPICGPLEGVKETSPGSGQWLNPEDGLHYSPPAHVRCRCDVAQEFV